MTNPARTVVDMLNAHMNPAAPEACDWGDLNSLCDQELPAEGTE